MSFPTSPALFSEAIRGHVPPTLAVVAIGGNRTSTRVEIINLDSPTPKERVCLVPDAEDWIHKNETNGSVRVLRTTEGVLNLLREAFPGAF